MSIPKYISIAESILEAISSHLDIYLDPMDEDAMLAEICDILEHELRE